MMHDEEVIRTFNENMDVTLKKLKSLDAKAYVSVDLVMKSLTLSNKLKMYELTYNKVCKNEELISMIRNKVKSFLTKADESEIEYYSSIIYGTWSDSIDIELPIKKIGK
jgi:hypothetical protein